MDGPEGGAVLGAVGDVPDAARRRWLLSALAGASAPVWAQGAGPAAPVPTLGSVLPLTEVPLLDGGVFRPADAEGKVVVLYYWASWCPFCAQQTPWMEKLWQAQRQRGLVVLGLSIDTQAADAIAYRARKGYTFPCGLLAGEVARALPKPKGLPVTIARGRDGRVAAAETGQLFPEDVEALARFL
ncbi:TlpA family protein disulfide reductase [Ideonella dechloratans]|uniref:TlpA family protein disulfide reductase n=1 Tax=Ideonella dechloratans TaxID=36863 RepID=UPI001E559FDB|nr:TlpA disulfide reductase family protein [Ideonella dechloratans]UFU11349.1 TlpA family protein disulfide reductase [Ideonella dechloratans]